MKSGEAADKLLDSFGRNRGQTYAVEEKRKIYAFGDRARWVYAVLGRHTSEACIIARLGFLTDWGKMGHRSGEHYDTSLSFRGGLRAAKPGSASRRLRVPSGGDGKTATGIASPAAGRRPNRRNAGVDIISPR